MKNQLRIDYDDDAMTIIDKLNQLLEDEGLDIELVDDGLDHDGYMIYTIRSTVEDD